jgi:hypothetical protein
MGGLLKTLTLCYYIHNVVELEVYMNWKAGNNGECCKCRTNFIRTGRNQKYCDSCKKDAGREAAHRCAVKSGRIKNPGVGSGNAQPTGKAHPTYKNGIANYSNFIKSACEKCESQRHLLVHHIDRDRTNNEPDNLETLCRRCHHFEHDIQNNLPKGEYLSKIKKAEMPTRKRKNGSFCK